MMANAKVKFRSCSICCASEISETSFISHVLGKKHRKKAKIRMRNGKSEMNHRLCITGLPDFRTVDAQLTKALLSFDIIDIEVYKNRTFVEFATQKAAKQTLKNGLNFQSVKLQFSCDKRHFRNQDQKVKDKPKLSPNVMEALTIPVRSTEEVDELVLQLVRDIELEPHDLQKREDTRYILETFLRLGFPHVRVCIFGSSANELGFKGCDVDLFADFGPDVWQEGKDSPWKAQNLTRHLAREIRQGRRGYNVIPISQARVPIVKFTDFTSHLDVDLSFKNAMPIYNTQLIKLYTTIHPLVRPYLMLLRFWAKVQDIAGGGEPNRLLTNYCFCMMMLFWLMLRENPVVPCVGELQAAAQYTPWNLIIINGWNCSFSRNVGYWKRKYHREAIFDLAMEFFRFYAFLDAKEWAISPIAGALIKKRDFINRSTVTAIPRYLEEFFHNNIPIQAKSPLCVQDPFEMQHNIASGLKDASLMLFQLKCRKSLDICRKIKIGKVPLSALFDEINADEALSLEERRQSNDANVIDEVVSVCSNDSIELLQELESLERNRGLLETPNTMSSVKARRGGKEQPGKSNNMNENVLPSTLMEISEEEREDLRVSLYGKKEEFSLEIIELNESSSTDSREEIIILQEVTGKIEQPSIEVIDLENDSIQENTKCAASGSQAKNTVVCENSQMGHTSSSHAESSSADTTVFPHMKSTAHSFKFDFEVDRFFKILSDGSLKFEERESLTDACKDSCVNDFWVFILKSILKCEVEVKDMLKSPDILDDYNKMRTLEGSTIKRKNVEFGEQAPPKYFKGSEKGGKSPGSEKGNMEEGKSADLRYVVIARHTSRNTVNVWEGRRNMTKSLVTKSVLSPLHSEMFITNLMTRDQARKYTEFSTDFETTLWKETSKPNAFWVTSKCNSLNPKVKNYFNNFFAFFAKLTINLATKINSIIKK